MIGRKWGGGGDFLSYNTHSDCAMLLEIILYQTFSRNVLSYLKMSALGCLACVMSAINIRESFFSTECMMGPGGS